MGINSAARLSWLGLLALSIPAEEKRVSKQNNSREMYERQVFTVCMTLFYYYLLELNLNQEALFWLHHNCCFYFIPHSKTGIDYSVRYLLVRAGAAEPESISAPH